MKNKVKITILSLVALVAASPAYAGSVAGIDSIAGPNLAGTGGAFSTPAPNNDNSVGLSGNRFGLLATFNPGATVADFVLNVVTTGGTTEYATGFAFGGALGTVEVRVTNNTGFNWDGFQIALGYGMISANGLSDSFILSTTSDFIDFDAPSRDTTPTSTHFGNLFHGPNLIQWDAGTVQSGQTTEFGFSIDVPDVNDFIPDEQHTTAGYDFSVRLKPLVGDETPPTSTEVPEPGTMALMGVGLAAFAWSKRRRK